MIYRNLLSHIINHKKSCTTILFEHASSVFFIPIPIIITYETLKKFPINFTNMEQKKKKSNINTNHYAIAAGGPSLPHHNNCNIDHPGGSGVHIQGHGRGGGGLRLRSEESNISYDIRTLYAYGFNYGINYNNVVSFNSGPDLKHIQDITKRQQEIIDKFRKWIPIKTDTTTNGLTFTVLNYNVLAQDLVQENSYLYKNHSARACLWETRWNNLYREISSYNADIICLQEVQETHLKNYFNKLEKLGYVGVYKRRTGTRPDGCALYYKKSIFTMSENTTIEFNQNTDALDRENVAIIARLSPKKQPENEFVVATTHLLYNPKRMDVRLAQTQVLLAEIERISFNPNNTSSGGSYVPIIITGDFNSKPDSAVYKLIVNGRLKYDNLSNRTLVPITANNSSGVEVVKNGKYLITSRLKITDNCQHYEIFKSRERGVQLSRAQELSLIALRKGKRTPVLDYDFRGDPRYFSTGVLSHNLNLMSAFKHAVANDDFEATTHQSTWITVDYIFYSGMFDNSTGHIVEDKLKLIENYRIPTATELQEVKYIPNFVIGSDHLPLLSKFKLIY